NDGRSAGDYGDVGGVRQGRSRDVRDAGADQGPLEVKRNLVAACVVSMVATLSVAAQSPAPVDTFDAVWKIVRDTHFDPRMNGVDWNALRTAPRPRALVRTT